MIQQDEVESLLALYEKGSNSKSFAAVEELIHPEATFRFTDGDFHGREEIRAAFERTWAFSVERDEYALSEIRIVTLDAQSASLTFNWTWSGEAGGKEFRHTGRGTSVILKTDGRLQLIFEHLSR